MIFLEFLPSFVNDILFCVNTYTIKFVGIEVSLSLYVTVNQIYICERLTFTISAKMPIDLNRLVLQFSKISRHESTHGDKIITAKKLGYNITLT